MPSSKTEDVQKYAFALDPGSLFLIIVQIGAPKIAKLVYTYNNGKHG